MNLVCLVLLACTVVSRLPEPRISCEPVASSCELLDDGELVEFRTWCRDEPRCIELTPLIFVLRRMMPEPSPPRPPDGTHL